MVIRSCTGSAVESGGEDSPRAEASVAEEVADAAAPETDAVEAPAADATDTEPPAADASATES